MSHPREQPPQPGLHPVEWSCELIGTALLELLAEHHAWGRFATSAEV